MDRLLALSKKVAQEAGQSARSIHSTYVKQALAYFAGIPSEEVQDLSLQEVWNTTTSNIPLDMNYRRTFIFVERMPVAVSLAGGMKTQLLMSINELWDPTGPALGVVQNSAGPGRDHLHLVLMDTLAFSTAEFERALVLRNYVVREYPKEDRVVFSTPLKNLKYND